ncbi:alpha/beta hydrolase [Mycobacterium sherrisii]|uniref:alpha/beta hydrolase n=1 Tax=Mycobacterium sherrisii TaxID=243061 RepID=UPI000A14C3B9|nr:alpha/beta fold hydrolase [Mycobacterium sherrisii]MCV7030604.1 alpha/beta fold hydrolase [Mycobacterium sherrisii]ORW77296.1 alpha/beta hydrolase [Mycobacterium sherrisii]
MAIHAKRRRVRQKLAGMPGVRPVRRPIFPGSPDEFDLYYVRTGRKSAHPLVIVPGGPGVASLQVYKGLRRRAANAGLDVIMIEHRGIGMSRQDDSGADLPPEAITVDQVVDDIAAVLDDARVDSTVTYGTSYGSYIAAGLGVRHPGRVHAMILDSPLLSRHDIVLVRDAVRGLLFDGGTPETAALVPKVRKLVDAGLLAGSAAEIATTSYAYGGASLLDRELDLLLSGRKLLWWALSRMSAIVSLNVAYRHEVDLVSRIAFRELDYAAEPDGLPFDPAAAMREIMDVTEAFESEPYDLVSEMPKFNWPTVVISGGRDLVTPRAVAERVASLVPGAVLLALPATAHSVLDFREPAALAVAAAVCRGDIDTLPGRGPALDMLPARPALRVLWKAVRAAAIVEGALPALPLQRRVKSA